MFLFTFLKENLNICKLKSCDKRLDKMNLFIGVGLIFLLVTITSCVSVNISFSSYVDNTERLVRFNKQNIKWSYECKYNQCHKTPMLKDQAAVSLETCVFACTTLPLWPQPTNVTIISRNSSSFNRESMFVALQVPEEIRKDLTEAYNIFANNLPACQDCNYFPNTSVVIITINVSEKERKLSLTTNESYLLQISGNGNTVSVSIKAPTFFGARHALETLTQLVWHDTNENCLKIFHDVTISDSPVFAHRGLMIDTARNYYSMDLLMKAVDGMAACKMNVLHLHLTDASSFPIILPNNPGFAEAGAYSSDKVYRPDEVRGLIEYSRIRGIKVVLEVDAPSHVYAGWDQFPKKFGNVTICGEDDPFNAHLNPDNPIALKLMESIYSDLFELGTDKQYFHLGADEVNTLCFAGTELMEEYADVLDLWSDYVNNMTKALKSANGALPKDVVVWSSEMTDCCLDKLTFMDNLVVQFWYGNIFPIMASGARVVFSTVGHWYLDCGYGPWKPSQMHPTCGPYTSWQKVYEYRPWTQFPAFREQVLGGEACLWSETIVPDSLQVRLWPRTAALSERLWSDPSWFDKEDVFFRLSSHRERLVERGVKTDAMWPEWCRRNHQKCT